MMLPSDGELSGFKRMVWDCTLIKAQSRSGSDEIICFVTDTVFFFLMQHSGELPGSSGRQILCSVSSLAFGYYVQVAKFVVTFCIVYELSFETKLSFLVCGDLVEIFHVCSASETLVAFGFLLRLIACYFPQFPA